MKLELRHRKHSRAPRELVNVEPVKRFTTKQLVQIVDAAPPRRWEQTARQRAAADELVRRGGA